MKKKLIIHIGIPKTASTTIQNSLFADLHGESLINYLGTAVLRYSDLKDGEVIRSKYSQIMKVLEGKCFNPLDHLLSKDKINIFSEEMLANPFIVQKFRGVAIDPLENAKIVSRYFDPEEIDIKILITLRNQQSMIPSYFVETYRYYANNKKLNRLGCFLDYIQKNPELFYSWQFDKLLQSWEEAFGKSNIKILFYEDFLDNPQKFSLELSNLLSIDHTLIQQLIYKKHFNKKEKTDEGTYREFKKVDFINHTINTLLKIRVLRIFLKYLKTKYITHKIYQLYKLIRFKRVLIKKPTEHEKEVIVSHYRESNLILNTKYGIPLDFLSKYKYI